MYDITVGKLKTTSHHCSQCHTKATFTASWKTKFRISKLITGKQDHTEFFCAAHVQKFANNHGLQVEIETKKE